MIVCNTEIANMDNSHGRYTEKTQVAGPSPEHECLNPPGRRMGSESRKGSEKEKGVARAIKKIRVSNAAHFFRGLNLQKFGLCSAVC